MKQRIVVIAIPHPSEPGLYLHGLRRDNGKWALPGGHAMPGENLIEAARREAREEAGLDIKEMEKHRNGQFGDNDVTLFGAKCPENLNLDSKDDPDQEFMSFKWLDPTSNRNLHVPAERNLLVQHLEGTKKTEPNLDDMTQSLEKRRAPSSFGDNSWSYHADPKVGAVHFNHVHHGTITIKKNPRLLGGKKNPYVALHNGASIGRWQTPREAVGGVSNYVRSLGAPSSMPHTRMLNVDPTKKEEMGIGTGGTRTFDQQKLANVSNSFNSATGPSSFSTGMSNVASAVSGFFGGSDPKNPSGLKKSKNVREQRKKAFGGWKTSPNSPKREKQMAHIKDYAEKRFNAPVARAAGKESSSGKMIDKPDLTTGRIEHIGNPDSLIHELAHLDMAPEGVDMSQFQQDMDKEWGRQNTEFGYKQQARGAPEYEATARENMIRRKLGLPAHAKQRDVKKPGQEMAADRPGLRVFRPVPGGKHLTGGQEVISPEKKRLLEARESSKSKYSPETGWQTEPSIHSIINLRAQGRNKTALNAVRRYFRKKAHSKLAASEKDLYKNAQLPTSAHISQLFNQGKYALMTPHRSGVNPEQNDASHRAFVKDVKSLGYEPIPVMGKWRGEQEPSYLIPNMIKEHAQILGQKYKQQAVIHGDKGVHEEISTHPSYKPMGIGQGHVANVHPEEDHTEVQTTEGPMRFKLNFPKMQKSESEGTQLIHYSHTPGLKSIDPKFMGTGAPGAEHKRAMPEVARSYFYMSGSTPEDIVTQSAKSKYIVNLAPEQKIYDLAEDKDGLVAHALKENQGAWDADMILGRVKGAGYHGFSNKGSAMPHVVALFHPVAPHKEEPAS